MIERLKKIKQEAGYQWRIFAWKIAIADSLMKARIENVKQNKQEAGYQESAGELKEDGFECQYCCHIVTLGPGTNRCEIFGAYEDCNLHRAYSINPHYVCRRFSQASPVPGSDSNRRFTKTKLFRSKSKQSPIPDGDTGKNQTTKSGGGK